jgi:hypothetical protein
MNPLTVHELRLRQAELSCRAERLRQEWRTLPATGKALRLGKQVKEIQDRADDYARLVELAEGL